LHQNPNILCTIVWLLQCAWFESSGSYETIFNPHTQDTKMTHQLCFSLLNFAVGNESNSREMD
jgi:hypothetical protein